MAQITLYLDEETQQLVEDAAKNQGVSKSRWVAEMIRKHAGHAWPKDCLLLAGRFPDFPLRDDSPEDAAADIPRIGF